MIKTEAPRSFCNVGNVIPIMKLKNHDDKLPIDIATGRGPTSNSSAQLKIELVNKSISFDETFVLTTATEERYWTESDLVDKNVPQESDDT